MVAAAPPIATYRLQMGPDMRFDDAVALVPYVRDLGASHLYLSPIMRARPGSTHGYDVVDPREVSPDLGGEEGLRRLAGAGLPLIVDIVPNHMAADDSNPFWRDPDLRARFFDIDPISGHARRFFDVDDLVGIRVEDPEVFDETHRTVRRLVEEGVLAGLRVDHVDGLADPAAYLERLASFGVPVWVEKILAADERLPDWPVDGTTGYDHLDAGLGVFVDPAAEEELTALWTELSGDPRTFEEHSEEARREQATGPLAPEVDRIGLLAPEVEDVAGAVAALPVYRTYVVPERREISAQDRLVIEGAGLPEALRRALLLQDPDREELVRRFQQTTPPVVAKGDEDTAFYRYLRMAALNEVGGHPGIFGASVAVTHRRLAALHARVPRSISTTTTHDTKRSADVRARIAALTTIPAEWAATVRRWRREHADLRRGPDGPPDAVEELLILQTLVGAWPITGERLEDYLLKAIREAKRTTAWVDGDEAWERGVLAYAHRLSERPRFVAELEDLIARTASAAEAATLGQALVKLTATGIPDLYRGDEDRFLALVDPDNRRPVDWDALRERLDRVHEGPLTPDLAKLGLVHRALELRRRRPAAFAGAYTPLEAGPDLLAYARGTEVVAAVPPRPAGARAVVAVPEELRGEWRNVLTGAESRLGASAPFADLAGEMAVVLLERA